MKLVKWEADSAALICLGDFQSSVNDMQVVRHNSHGTDTYIMMDDHQFSKLKDLVEKSLDDESFEDIDKLLEQV